MTTGRTHTDQALAQVQPQHRRQQLRRGRPDRDNWLVRDSKNPTASSSPSGAGMGRIHR